MTAPDLVLHVGMQQSAATLLQRQLLRLRPQLRSNGVAFVAHGEINGLAATDGWQRAGNHNLAQAADFAAELAAVVAQEREHAGASAVTLISSDHLTGRANLGPADCATFRPHAEGAVGQFIGALAAERVRIVLYTRRQDRLMELSYLREIQKGRDHRFEDQFPCHQQGALDYCTLIERLRALPQVSDVRVRPVELLDAGVPALVDDFLAAVDLQGKLDLDEVDQRASAYRVFSRRALRMALGMYQHLDTREERELVRTFLLDTFGTHDDRQSRFLPKATRREILAAHAEANRNLFSTFMPDLPPDSYESNAATSRLGDLLPVPAPAPNPPAAAPARQQTRGSAIDAAKDTAARLAEHNPAVYRAKVRYLARKTDAFLISFPKCGRTWLRVLLAHAAAGHAGIRVGNPLRFTTAQQVHPDIPRVLATHDDSPQNKVFSAVIADKRAYRGRKVIFLVRDPRDVIVSLYFHVTRRHRQHYQGSISDFVRDPVGSLASLLAFYDAWVAQQHHHQLLLVRYEDMKADTAQELRRVLSFLGLEDVDDAVVNDAVEQASFERLQKAERSGTAKTKALRTSSADDPESFKVRRGKVGGYTDYLTAEDVAFINTAIAASAGARELGYAETQGAGDDAQ